MGRIHGMNRLTPREQMFFRAYIKGATEKDAYLLIRPDVQPDSASTLGGRILKRIKKKLPTGRTPLNPPMSAECDLSVISKICLMILMLTFGWGLLNCSPKCWASLRLISTSIPTSSKSSPLPDPRISHPMTIDFSRLPEVINKAYYPYLFNDRRFNVFYGGAGSGKSVFVAQRYVHRMTTKRGHNVLGVRKIDKANRDSTFAMMIQVINMWGLRDFFHVTMQPLSITCKHNGNQMLFRGLDDPEKLKSITFSNGPLTDIWCEEASELTPSDDRQLRLRLRGFAAVQKQVTYTFNPIDAQHWLKGRFFDNPPPAERASVLKTTYKDNAWLTKEDKVELEALKDEDLTYYQIYCLGEWGVIGNVVFMNYVIEDYSYDYADFDAVYQGQDYGFNHPSAFELVGMKDGELYIFDEVYKRQRTNGEFIEDSRQYFDERKLLVIVKNGFTTADSAEPDRIKEWRQSGWNVTASKKGPGSEKFGIDFLKHHRMHINRARCPGIAAEIPIYKYREDKNGNVLDEFVDFKNDGIAAVRYATESMHKAKGAHIGWV